MQMEIQPLPERSFPVSGGGVSLGPGILLNLPSLVSANLLARKGPKAGRKQNKRGEGLPQPSFYP